MAIATEMPRILFVVENNTVPTDIRVWREARTAKAAGASVTIISPQTKQFSKSYEVLDGIEIYRHHVMDSNGSQLGTLVEYANAVFWEVCLCLKVFVRNRFHVIHGANPPDHLFLIALLFRMVGVRFIFDHHDLAPELYLSKFGRDKNTIYGLLSWMEKWSCLTADAVVSTNQSYKKHVIARYGLHPDKIFIVRNDPEAPGTYQDASSEQHHNKQVTALLYTGSINKQDGVDLLIKTIHILVQQLEQRHIHCTVMGDGDDLPRVQKLCTELGISSYFSFTGYIYDRKIVERHIAEADICLETAPYSEVNHKSTFIKVMEYMAAGKPIVAFDLEETRFSVQDSALLVEQGNLMAFAEAIAKLAREPHLRHELGQYGRTRIIQELNWNHSSKELLKAYEYVYHNGASGSSTEREGRGVKDSSNDHLRPL